MPAAKPSQTTLLWYDYETWGANAHRDGIAQFAAVRTDLELNPIGEPINLFCRPNIDQLVSPGAVMVTGLSPLKLQDSALNEFEFAQAIQEVMSVPGTCTVGYNSIRFDDECTRFLFYRNLLDPYSREWRNGNSRWDLLDVVRMTYALRPEGIEWPLHEDGSPSFRLEDLTAANGIGHEQAHDAVSDVFATIAMAKLIKTQQPKLFDFAFSLRNKHRVHDLLDLVHRQPHLHFTGKIPAKAHCLGVEIPIAIHAQRKNEVIVLDIREDPSWLIDHDAETLRDWLYTRQADLPENAKRPPLRTLHLNRSPMIAPMSVLSDADYERLALSKDALEEHRQWVEANPSVIELVNDVFAKERENAELPAEHALYQGFIGDADRRLLNKLAWQKVPPERWWHETSHFHDDRLPVLIENLLARHYSDELPEAVYRQWQASRGNYLNDKDQGADGTLEGCLAEARALVNEHPTHQALLDTVKYLESLAERWSVIDPTSESAIIASEKPESLEPIETEPAPTQTTQQLDLF